MLKWKTRFALNRISKIGIITCLAASVTFAGFTVYGSKVGNFVVEIEETKGDLKITDSADPMSDEAELTTILSTPALKKQVDATYTWIPSSIAEGMGSKNDEDHYWYFAYSFYLVNTGSAAVDYEFGTYLTEVTNNADEIVRFMIIKGETYTSGQDLEYPADPDKSTGTIYAKAEASEENKTDTETNAKYPSAQVDFYDSDIVCLNQEEIEGYSCVKYTLVMWIEGYDNECEDGHIGGTIKMEVNITQMG